MFISVEENSQSPPPVETIRKLFELTHKEAQLALCLANGRSLQEAAGDLGITLNTARAHLRSTFSKTGIDRQARPGARDLKKRRPAGWLKLIARRIAVRIAPGRPCL